MTTAAPRRRFRLLYLAPVFALVAIIAWAFASPIGSSPDDDFHLASIWCATSNPAECKAGPIPSERYVPKAVHLAPNCYAYRPNVSAACQTETLSLSPKPTVLTNRGSFTNSYPPVYYATMNIFVGPNILASVIAMRVFNAVLFVALTSVLFVLLPRRRRATLIWEWLITCVPLGLFLLASNNPSSWAVIGIGSLWIALIGYFETIGKRRIGLGVLVVLSAVMAAGSRADSAVYAVISIAVVFLLTFRREKAYFLSAIMPLALVVLALVFYFSSGQASVASTGLAVNDIAPARRDISSLLYFNLENVQSLWVGSFGLWNLGWLDTAMPPIVIFGATGSAFAVMFAGIAHVSRRKILSLLLVAFILLALPIYVLTVGGSFVGESVQPRYLLPLVILLAGVALLQVNARQIRFSLPQVILVVAGLCSAQSVALHENIRRYTSGADVSGFNLNSRLEWWWPGLPVGPMVVWAAGSIAFAAVAIILIRELRKPTGLPEVQAVPASTLELTE